MTGVIYTSYGPFFPELIPQINITNSINSPRRNSFLLTNSTQYWNPKRLQKLRKSCTWSLKKINLYQKFHDPQTGL